MRTGCESRATSAPTISGHAALEQTDRLPRSAWLGRPLRKRVAKVYAARRTHASRRSPGRGGRSARARPGGALPSGRLARSPRLRRGTPRRVRRRARRARRPATGAVLRRHAIAHDGVFGDLEREYRRPLLALRAERTQRRTVERKAEVVAMRAGHRSPYAPAPRRGPREARGQRGGDRVGVGASNATFGSYATSRRSPAAKRA